MGPSADTIRSRLENESLAETTVRALGMTCRELCAKSSYRWLLIGTDTSALPFIATARRRHLEEFPVVDNGLSRTVRQALSVLREHLRFTDCL